MEDELKNRRKFLMGVPACIAGLFVASAATAEIVKKGLATKGSSSPNSSDRFERDALVGQSQMPEALVETHEGDVLRLYDDLIKGKVVTINFMSIANEATFPISAKLAEVARLLGKRLDQDVRMISITHDPKNDTPERLREFAKQIGAPSGWHFVRATGDGTAKFLSRLYHHGPRKNINITIDMVHYGNAAVGLWASFPSDIQPIDASMRIASVMSRKPISGPITLAGPRRLGADGPSFTNRVA
jgi:cytochrome oxidase Cu insertion factor (SCO1/SenC/PrrC family)